MKKRNKVEKNFASIGKVVCTIAGGAVGFVLGTPVLAIPGLFVGYIVGALLEKGSLNFLSFGI